MAREINLAVRSDQLERKVKEIIKATGLNVEDVVRNESRLLIEELVDRTKPRSLSKLKGKINRTYRRVFIAKTRGAREIGPEALRELYKAQANGRYRAKPLLAVVRSVLTDAIRKAQTHMGFFAAGWLGRGNPLSARRGIPGYVRRQLIQGTVIEKKSINSERVTGTNTVEFMRHFPKIKAAEKRLLDAAMETRIYKIGLNLKRIMQGQAKYRIPK